MSPSPSIARPHRSAFPYLIYCIVTISYVLRIFLASRGGQFFWVDEVRYARVFAVITAYVSGGMGAGLTKFLEHVDHNGFTLISLPPVLLQYTLKKLFGLPLEATGMVPVFWFAAFSVGVIWLVYGLALRLSSSRREALLAAFLAACSNTLFYFSRHFTPYDSSLFLGLLSLWLALRRPCPLSVRFLSGLCAGLAFATYNGFWTNVIFMLALALWPFGLTKDWLTRAVVTGLGFLLLPITFECLSLIYVHQSFFATLSQFAGTITQGEASEGWWLPLEYFWFSEKGIFLFWLAGMGLLPWIAKRQSGNDRRRGESWFFAVLVPYLLVCFFSVGLHKFVVYGRTVRPLVPFFCLASAFVADYFLTRGHRPRAIPGLAAGIALLAAVNFAAPFSLHFPLDFERVAKMPAGTAQRYSTVLREGESSVLPENGYVLVNVQSHFYPPVRTQPLPHGVSLAASAHPLSFFPYQYEGYSGPQRKLLRESDLTMRVIKLPSSLPNGGHDEKK